MRLIKFGVDSAFFSGSHEFYRVVKTAMERV